MKRARSFQYAATLLLLLAALAIILGFAQATANAQAQTTDYNLSALEKAVLDEMNLARTAPASYAAYLEAWRGYYKGKTFRQPGVAPVETIEGAAALEDAIRFLKSAKPLPPLQLSKGMCLGAKDQSFDQGQTGDVSHQGKDRSFSWDRVARYGQWQTPVSENIAYDSGTARDIVINLIIDDGIASRGHRNNIFNASHIVTGISCGKHPLFGNMCVCTFAAGFKDKSPEGKSAEGATPATKEAPKARKL